MPSFITPNSMARHLQEGYRSLEDDRKRLASTLIEYRGQDGTRRPINLIAQAGNILVPNLISEVPEHRVRSPLAELRGEASLLELALDRVWEDSEALYETRSAVLDAILGPIGILRLGMRAGKDFVTVDDNKRVPVAEPFCRRISLEDYACDPAARTRRELRWEAIKYRMPRQESIESGIFGRDSSDYLAHATCEHCGNQWDLSEDDPSLADTAGPGLTICPACAQVAPYDREIPIPNVATRAEAAQILRDTPGLEKRVGSTDNLSDIGRDTGTPDRFSLIDTIELWDVFIYTGDGIFTVTIPATQDPKSIAKDGDGKWLLAEKWQGPDPGPLLTLGFLDMPDSVLYKPYVADFRDLHDLMKIVSAKIGREAEIAKVVWGYTADTEDEAMTVRDMRDSGLVKLARGGKDSVQKLEVVGVVKELMGVLAWAKQEAADATGNLPLVGGQESGATDGTATAAQYLQANANLRISAMRERADRVLRAIDRFFGFWLTSDPLVKLPLPYRPPGGEAVTLTFDAATRRGDFISYNFDIERYSAVGMDPNVRLKRVTEFLELLIQMVPAIQAGIVSPDGLASIARQEFGIENIDELLPQQGMAQQMLAHMARQGVQAQPGQPQPVPGMNPAANNAGSPAMSGAENTNPTMLNRGAMSVGVGQ